MYVYVRGRGLKRYTQEQEGDLCNWICSACCRCRYSFQPLDEIPSTKEDTEPIGTRTTKCGYTGIGTRRAASETPSTLTLYRGRAAVAVA